jgi:hypothetical protein
VRCVEFTGLQLHVYHLHCLHLTGIYICREDEEDE